MISPLRVPSPLSFATALVVASLVFGTACEKKKDLTFAQGAGDNLFAISDYTSMTFTVTTGKRRFKGQTSRADKLVVLDKFDGINSLDAVEFAIEEGLFAGVDLTDFNFYGRENHPYVLTYSFTDSNVILSKIADKQDIPSQELTYAKSLGDNKYEVPLMGLPISLLTVERVRDDRGKDTRKLATFDKDYLNEASHFKIKATQVRYFEATAKPDLLSANYFSPNDEWLYTKTIVGRSLNSSAILGATEAALKIKFARTNNSILGIDLNIAKEQEVLDPTKVITALEIPVEWVDFKLVTAGADSLLKENKLGNEETGSRSWQERSYALVDFNNVDRLSRTYTADNKLEKLEISDSYISFTIYESSTGNTYKYSLAKNNTRVAGQNLYADDTKYFHIFAEKRKVIKGGLFRQEPDFRRLVFANRFYPENNEIVYHISDNTPNDPAYLQSIQKAVEAWDVAFQKAGTNIRVRLDSKRVEMGDVRYNQIGFYGYEIDSSMDGGGMLLGFGPSVQDTRTGQTFVATTHIYLRAYREGVISGIRSFIRNQIGLYDDKKVEGISHFEKSDAVIASNAYVHPSLGSVSGIANLYQSLQSNEGMGFEKIDSIRTSFASQIELNYGVDALTKSVQDNHKKIASASDSKSYENACSFGNVAASSNSWKKISDLCLDGRTSMSNYLDRLKEAHAADPRVLNVEGEEDAILACAQPLMPDLLTSTLIHELGHNLGLGHNFAGSSDEANFLKKDDGEYAFPSSTVMDYPARDYDLYDRAGNYDIAAIRYLYGRKVETTDGRIISIGAKQSIEEAARGANATPRPYEVCNDALNRSNVPFYNPLCLKWDVGATPLQYVDWAISQIHADIIQNGYAYNDISLSQAGASTSHFMNFRQIHDYWRYMLRSEAGDYLERKSEKELAELITSMSEKDKRFKSYTMATKKIFDFAMEVINLPGRVCLVFDTAENAVIGVEEFRLLRSDIYQMVDSHPTVQNCVQAQSHLAAARSQYSKLTVKLIDKGHEIENLELDLNPESAADRLKRGFDFGNKIELNPSYSTGTLIFKIAAMNMLLQRLPLGGRQASLQLLDNARMTPNFLDVPEFRSRIIQTALMQALRGAPIDQLGLEPKGNYLPLFAENADVTVGLLTALTDPRAQAISSGIRDAFTMTYQNTSAGLGKFVPNATTLFGPEFIYTKANQKIYGASIDEAPFANALVRKLELLKQSEAFPAPAPGLAATLVAGATEVGQVMDALIQGFENSGLYLQPFQYQKLATALAAVSTPQENGTRLLDPATYPAVLESFFVGSETEILGWSKAEFEAARAFKAENPTNFSAQKQILNTLILSGIII